MNKIVLNIQDAYYQSHRDYHNYQDWEQEQWGRVEKAEQEASQEIDALQAELEKCKQTLARYEQMLAAALEYFEIINKESNSKTCDCDAYSNIALAKIEEMGAKK